MLTYLEVDERQITAAERVSLRHFGICIRPIVWLILPTITVEVRLHPRHVFPEVQTSNNPFRIISPARGRVKPPTNYGDRAGIRLPHLPPGPHLLRVITMFCLTGLGRLATLQPYT